MEPDDLAALQKAVQSLEHPSLAARLTNSVGKPVELIGLALPASASRAIATATSSSSLKNLETEAFLSFADRCSGGVFDSLRRFCSLDAELATRQPVWECGSGCRRSD
jgi:hypothetical protein